jgi:hypothetical protein
MNVFADLIEELKEENLLEETVIDVNKRALEIRSKSATGELPGAKGFHLDAEDSLTNLEFQVPEVAVSETAAENAAPVDEAESFRKRAMEEVSSLQMVEHVLSGIEREHMKMVPATYDDLGVKKALHRFLQVTNEVHSSEHSEAEYALMQETENWFSALSKRDSNISVANIRRFCENSRPVLSSQALVALARFYRNAPYGEPVRGKFDFVMTRLFSRDTGEDKRKLLFERREMIGHVKTLYANWASLLLFSDVETDTEVADAVAKFEGFLNEAQNAETFDVLIASDFFNRIRLFKEGTSEMFYAADVIAAAIECNVKIGNRFVELIRSERESSNIASIEEKYGYSYDTIVSNAASKTLLLAELLKEEAKASEEPFELDIETPEPVPTAISYTRAPVDEAAGFRLFSTNKWLVVITIVVLILSASIYLWSENVTENQGGIEVAANVDLGPTDLKTHLRQASSSSETFYGIVNPTWDTISEEEKKEFMKKALAFATGINLKRVNLLNSKGRTVAYASADRLEFFTP